MPLIARVVWIAPPDRPPGPRSHMLLAAPDALARTLKEDLAITSPVERGRAVRQAAARVDPRRTSPA